MVKLLKMYMACITFVVNQILSEPYIPTIGFSCERADFTSTKYCLSSQI